MNKIINYFKLILAIVMPIALSSCSEEEKKIGVELITNIDIVPQKSNEELVDNQRKEEKLVIMRLAVFDKTPELKYNGTPNIQYGNVGEQISIKTVPTTYAKKIFCFANFNNDDYWNDLTIVDKLYKGAYTIDYVFKENDGKGSYIGDNIPDKMLANGLPMSAILDDFDLDNPAKMKFIGSLAKVTVKLSTDLESSRQYVQLMPTSTITYTTNEGGYIIGKEQGNTNLNLFPNIVTHEAPRSKAVLLFRDNEPRKVITMYLPPRSLEGDGQLKINIKGVEFFYPDLASVVGDLPEIIIKANDKVSEFKAGYGYEINLSLKGHTTGFGDLGVAIREVGTYAPPVEHNAFPPLPSHDFEPANCFMTVAGSDNNVSSTFSANVIGRVYTGDHDEDSNEYKRIISEYDPGNYKAENKNRVIHVRRNGYTYFMINTDHVKVTWQTKGGRTSWSGENIANQTTPNIIHSCEYDRKTGLCNFKTANSPNNQTGGAKQWGITGATGGGNALISAHDKSGKVLWSWHVWVLDDENYETEDYSIKSGSDRSKFVQGLTLGALGNSRDAFPTEDDVNYTGFDTGGRGSSFCSYGMLYQWGRKDPFPSAPGGDNVGHPDSFRPKIIDENGNPNRKVTKRDYGHNLVSTTDLISNPTTLYRGIGTYPKDEMEKSWWRSDVKTLYDPCPKNYRVSKDGDMFKAITGSSTEGGPSTLSFRVAHVGQSYLSAMLNVEAPIYSNNAAGEGYIGKNRRGIAGYGFRGVVHPHDGTVQESGSNGYYWTSEVAAGQPYHLRFGDVNVESNGVLRGLYKNDRVASFAYAVQCVRYQRF